MQTIDFNEFSQALAENYVHVKLKILPNGNFKPIKNLVLVQNTTLFDTVAHILGCLIIDNPQMGKDHLRPIIDLNTHKFLSDYLNDGVGAKTLQSRCALLQSMIGIQIDSGFRTLDCIQIEIDQLMNSFTKNVLFSAVSSVYSGCTCDQEIANEEVKSFFKIDTNMLNQLESNIIFTEEIVCNKCKNYIVTGYTLESYVFLLIDETSAFEEIPKKAILQGSKYSLCAIIEKISNTHFVAHILRPNNKWYTFDNTNNDVMASDLKKKTSSFRLIVLFEGRNLWQRTELGKRNHKQFHFEKFSYVQVQFGRFKRCICL